MIYFVIGLVVIVPVAYFLALERKKDSERDKKVVWEEPYKSPFPYVKRRSILNSSEYVFHEELKRQLPKGYNIFSKMRIADFITTTQNNDPAIRKIWAKHVDFLVCNPNAQPIVAIEINGNSHLSPDRVERDEFVKQALQAAGLPLEVVVLGSNFEQAAETIIQKYLK